VASGLLAIAFSATFLGASCGQSALGVMPGVVNDPHNLSLRRAILSYGTSHMCAEMLSRSVPLKMRDEDPVTGRFYPTSCFAQELANNHMFIQFGGYGYAWTNLTKRMAFDAGGAVEYEQDFLMDGGTMYVYFRQKSTSAAKLDTKMIEQPTANVLAGMPAAEGQSYATSVGTEILKSEVGRGFTVIRDADGNAEFGLGVVEKGQHPKSPYPFRETDSNKQVLANERTEIHQGQRDYAGPFAVGDGRALYVTAAVEGAPAVDVLVVPRGLGEQWLADYTKRPATTPPPGAPILTEPLASGPVFRRMLRVPKGEYFVVFDNTATAGPTQPTVVLGDDRAALVSYAVETGSPP
jgi:hypothetical protein